MSDVEDNLYKIPLAEVIKTIDHKILINSFHDLMVSANALDIEPALPLKILITESGLQLGFSCYRIWHIFLQAYGDKNAKTKVALVVKTKKIELPCYDVETELYRFLFECNPHLGDFETFKTLYL